MAELDGLRRVVYEGNPEVLTAVIEEMNHSRVRWLHERSENDWLEITDPGIEMPGISQRFLGGLTNLGGNR